jgi:DNA-3-methyladenine glycosylase
MFCRAGTAYVYLIYGMHWCINVATGAEGFPAAVLIRAAIPVDGIAAARERRPGRPDHELMRGPATWPAPSPWTARRTAGMMDGPAALVRPRAAPCPDDEVAAGPRIGHHARRRRAAPVLGCAGSRYVSGKRS